MNDEKTDEVSVMKNEHNISGKNEHFSGTPVGNENLHFQGPTIPPARPCRP